MRLLFAVASTLAERRSGFCTAMVLTVVLLSVSAAPAPALAQDVSAIRSSASHPYASHVADAARRFGIPEAWIWAVMRVESNGDARAVSTAGAMGLMQIMPATWTELRARHGLGADPFDARDNIMAGTAYLRAMHDRYGNVTAMLAAYNAGPGRYDEHLRGRPLPTETRAYLARLASITGGASDVQLAAAPPDPLAWRRAALFVGTNVDAIRPGAARVASTAETGAVAVVPLDAQSDRPSADDHGAADHSAQSQSVGLFVRRTGAGRPQ